MSRRRRQSSVVPSRVISGMPQTADDAVLEVGLEGVEQGHFAGGAFDRAGRAEVGDEFVVAWAEVLLDRQGEVVDHAVPGVLRRAAKQVSPLDADFELALVADEAIPEPLGVVLDVLGEALDDGDPDHVGGEDQGPVLAEGEVGGGEQRVEGDLLDAVGRVVAAGFDLGTQQAFIASWVLRVGSGFVARSTECSENDRASYLGLGTHGKSSVMVGFPIRRRDRKPGRFMAFRQFWGTAKRKSPAGESSGQGPCSFPESSGAGSRRQKRPDFRQQRLEPLARPARAQVVPADLLDQFLVAVDDPPAAFHLRFAGESPSGVCSSARKKRLVGLVLLVHGPPPFWLGVMLGGHGEGEEEVRFSCCP